ncbi:Autoinducer 2 sensor kinase/phosphatase LuxQ [Massilia sp. Bi118]|uniref:PAS domain-containing hybrid sensor histidine kinase/response regulator n=1 Tax=Massilia sp. Bi118 TaxID=2822346 RepID=UPI001DBED807|nr:PAS domain-containing protein [Massilia sp. Bi118]CAH0312303.1 Autoinducer 2 sensor kinase/phosphatase LuxQ [Massilia sp. Bi118]
MTHRDAFLANGGDAGARTLAQDWHAHPLGPMQDWPAALRMSLGMVLGSSFPSFIAWGEELFVFYNDAYAPMLGNKPGAIGLPLPQLWSEVWDTMAPLARRVLDGEALFFENFQLTVERKGYPEQAWFTFSYSPLRDETGAVRGLLCTVVEVSDKVLALARHKEAEERYALCLEASGNIGTWAYELDTGATFVDEQFARLFQVDAALARAGTDLARFTGMIHPDDRPRVVAAIEQAIACDTLYDVEYRIPQLSRENIWVNARGKVFRDVATGRRRFAGVAVDITERKKGELARHDSERIASEALLRELENRRRLDVLLDAAPVGIVYVDADGGMLVANAANRAVWGDHPNAGHVDEYGEWKGWWPAGAPQGGQALGLDEWPITRVLRGEDSAGATIEIEPFGAPGTRRTILIRTAAIRNEHGEVVGAVGANMDISAQVAAERAMKESEAKFRSIANVIPQMVWSAPASGGNDYLNSRWPEFTGLPPERCAGYGWKEYIHPDDLPALVEAWDRSRDGGAPFEVEHRLIHHSGQYRWVLNRAEPMTGDDGAIVRWMGSLTDIHDKKRGEEELKAAARRKDEFLAMLAHELRNPLAPISSAAQLLGHVAADENKVRQASDIILRQVRHLTGLVDDLLDVSRVTRGLVELQRERVDLKAVMASAVEQARPLVEARRHHLDLALDAAPAWVAGDRIRLVQVVANLLNNAAKYTPQGGALALSLEVSSGQASIAVRDNGIGIDPELLPRVFELFTQAERTPDRAQGGLGLGLALVKSLVGLHGGSVEAESGGPGMGSTFRILLPLAQAGRAAASGDDAAGALYAQPERHVLIVDDNADAAESLAEILRALGNRVAVAHDPRQALALAEQDWPEVFILDIGLPDIDGYALARRLRAMAEGQPTRQPALYLALTGYGQAHDKVLSKAAGFDRHFVKPVDLEALLAALAEAPGR